MGLLMLYSQSCWADYIQSLIQCLPFRRCWVNVHLSSASLFWTIFYCGLKRFSKYFLILFWFMETVNFKGLIQGHIEKKEEELKSSGFNACALHRLLVVYRKMQCPITQSLSGTQAEGGDSGGRERCWRWKIWKRPVSTHCEQEVNEDASACLPN